MGREGASCKGTGEIRSRPAPSRSSRAAPGRPARRGAVGSAAPLAAVFLPRGCSLGERRPGPQVGRCVLGSAIRAVPLCNKAAVRVTHTLNEEVLNFINIHIYHNYTADNIQAATNIRSSNIWRHSLFSGVSSIMWQHVTSAVFQQSCLLISILFSGETSRANICLFRIITSRECSKHEQCESAG